MNIQNIIYQIPAQVRQSFADIVIRMEQEQKSFSEALRMARNKPKPKAIRYKLNSKTYVAFMWALFITWTAFFLGGIILTAYVIALK